MIVNKNKSLINKIQKTNKLIKKEDVKKSSKFWTQMDFESIPFKYLISIYLKKLYV